MYPRAPRLLVTESALLISILRGGVAIPASKAFTEKDKSRRVEVTGHCEFHLAAIKE